MDHTNTSLKIAGGAAIVLLIGAITWGGWNAKLKGNFETDLDRQKLRSEQLLSEKLLVEKDLQATHSKMINLRDRNETLARQIGETENMNSLKDRSIQQLQRQMATNTKSYNDLVALNREMENRLAALDQQRARLEGEQLAATEETEALREQVDNLKRELAMAHNAYYDKALVESTRGKNNKLVVKAGRTKKLKATIMIPSALKDLQFHVFDPSGALISNEPGNGILAVRITDPDNTLASSSNGGAAKTHKQAEMTYLPKKKLIRGTYRIEVLSESLLVGSLQVRLR